MAIVDIEGKNTSCFNVSFIAAVLSSQDYMYDTQIPLKERWNKNERNK